MNKLIVAGLCAALILGGILGVTVGRRIFPNTITVEKEKIVYKEKTETKVDAKTKITDNVDSNKNEKKNIHREKTVVVNKDGTKTIKSTVDVNSNTTEVKTEVKYVDREVVVEKRVEVEKLVTKEVTSAPDWIFSAHLGTAPLQLTPTITAPYISPVIVGIGVDRRVAGPVYIGGWANTDINKPLNIAAGLSLTVPMSF